MTSQKTPWDLDVRVRDRNIRKGVLEDKDVEKYLRELPDSAANAENVTIPQPAVAGAPAAATPAPPPVAPAPSTPQVGS